MFWLAACIFGGVVGWVACALSNRDKWLNAQRDWRLAYTRERQSHEAWLESEGYFDLLRVYSKTDPEIIHLMEGIKEREEEMNLLPDPAPSLS